MSRAVMGCCAALLVAHAGLAGAAGSYRVVKGDTLNAIAKTLRVDPGDLQEANGLRSDRLKPGQELKVPSARRPAGAKGASAKRAEREALGASRARPRASRQDLPAAEIYVVRKGDTLQGLARRFGVPADELRRRNGLRSGKLKRGQRLVIGRREPRAPEPEPERPTEETRTAEAKLESDLRSISADDARELTLTERVVRLAERMLDLPYRFGGNSVRGIDCSAYVQKVFRFLNVPLPRTACEQFKRGVEVELGELACGDLVFFHTQSSRSRWHVGIYLGSSQFIHATSIGNRVRISSLEEPYYRRRFIGGKRVLEDAYAAASGS